MKQLRISKRVLAVLLVLAAVFTVSLGGVVRSTLAYSANVTLSEQEGKPVFTLGNSADGTNNLFPDFSGVMPGDHLTQTITFATGSNSYQYDVYLYARVCDKNSADHPGISTPGFLEYLTLNVTQEGKTEALGGKEFGTVSGDAVTGVLLGRFGANQSTTLTVDLGVDINMGNDFQNAAAYIDWVFYAQQVDNGGGGGNPPDPPEEIPDEPTPGGDNPGEEIPDEPTPGGDGPGEEDIEEGGVPTGDMPNTGDDTPVLLWAGLMAASGCGILVLLLTGRKKKEEEQVG